MCKRTSACTLNIMLIFAVLISLLGISHCLPARAVTISELLENYIPTSNGRYKTVQKALELMLIHGHRNIVETGTARGGKSGCGGDGCSTVIFSHFAQLNRGMTVESVDISRDNVEASWNAVKDFGTARVICQDSVQFLKHYPGKIDFLYLDSYDFDFNNPGPSQEHHLKEIIVAYQKLHDKSVVMVDDCSLPHGGKCALVKLFLSELGWKVVMEGYQVIMAPPNLNTD